MTAVVWHFELTGQREQILAMPAGAELLTAALQHGEIQLWIKADPDAPPRPRLIRVAGTGEELAADPGRHVATVQISAGHLVAHVFDGGWIDGDEEPPREAP